MKILVTGANRGLGYALSKAAVLRGHTVLACARNEDQLKDLIEQYPNQVHPLELDVTDEKSVAVAAAKASEKWESIDVIINNAGALYERDAKIEDLDFSLLERTMNVNLYGPMRVVKHFLPLLFKGTDQTIINISSDAGSITTAYGGDYPYAISKTALNMFTKQIKHYVSNKNINVYAIHPGWIKTDMGGERAPGSPDDTANNLIDIVEKKKIIDEDLFFIKHDGESMKI
ncbi:SDR family oxidoreductase [Lederbergia wuyishanensis]|uniref:NAD(P)-dependent dehydrogenase (Short-subunit alcohol dehydrogenase family) n=1 Tax=Lederbergia wuyishanensis TaxID=1347903 RepID=A0ABU0CZ28_9BACI|nr:SDR family oxidoreductase [Lederbergia wuyishanensis]MCJ8006045.1 SDR family oxidoreductase [Lederbergia wuyishanensis]MDQ0341414.1 NAD(P)-dependent dehydrogenase (short-subunit alcohol dehydrogenase family) [Lederbergia wuyishanensis]